MWTHWACARCDCSTKADAWTSSSVVKRPRPRFRRWTVECFPAMVAVDLRIPIKTIIEIQHSRFSPIPPAHPCRRLDVVHLIAKARSHPNTSAIGEAEAIILFASHALVWIVHCRHLSDDGAQLLFFRVPLPTHLQGWASAKAC